MGLFGLFKKKEPSHSEKVALAYGCYKPELVGMIFPGKQKQAEIIISSLSKIYNLDLSKCSAEKYYEILSTYSTVYIRQVMTHSSEDSIIMALKSKFGDLVTNTAVARKTIAYVKVNMMNNEFILDTDESFTVLDTLFNGSVQMTKATQENQQAEKENLNSPEYGLVPNQPIYTSGVRGSKEYLAKLKTLNGDTLTWERHGSTAVDGINGMIDIYEGYLPSGESYKVLYVNMYSSDNSKVAPAGFVMT